MSIMQMILDRVNLLASINFFTYFNIKNISLNRFNAGPMYKYYVKIQVDEMKDLRAIFFKKNHRYYTKYQKENFSYISF